MHALVTFLKGSLHVPKESAIALCYIIGVQLLVVAVVLLMRRDRKTRAPFADVAGEKVALLRQPGETLLKQWIDENDRAPLLFVRAIILPPVAASLTWFALICLALLLNSPTIGPIIVSGANALFFAILLITLAFNIRRFIMSARQAGRTYLGYFGERYVADALAPLCHKRYHVFHDVPTPSGNIDHLAVGPTGIFVIETKTRRKGKAREDYRVIFDGRSLVWPWGEDNSPLEQAERLSVWLMDTIHKTSGFRPFVTPIVTIPEWWVEPRATTRGDARLARVVVTKALEKFILNGKTTLPDNQIASVCAFLDQKCRTVTY